MNGLAGLNGLHYHDGACLRHKADGSIYCSRDEIITSRDSKIYMRGFEDGQAMGRVSAELQAKAERAALAAHWDDGNANS